jgi:hypothetical protein
MDSLISEAKEHSKIKRTRSQVYVIADTMPDDLRAELKDALADRSITAPGLAKVLQDRGYDLSSASIQHFRGKGNTL